ncbi:MAG: carboxymuconolactone decarboxylase family protein [Desulfovermiculus sp.]
MSKETLKELQTGVTKLARTQKDFVRAMMNPSEMAAQDGALPRKMKKLIFVALSVQQQCSYCIAHTSMMPWMRGPRQKKFMRLLK